MSVCVGAILLSCQVYLCASKGNKRTIERINYCSMTLKLSTIDEGIWNQWVASFHAYPVCLRQSLRFVLLWMMVINGEKRKRKGTHSDISYSILFSFSSSSLLQSRLASRLLCRSAVFFKRYERIRFSGSFFSFFFWQDGMTFAYERRRQTQILLVIACSREEYILRRELQSLSLSFPLLAISQTGGEKKKCKTLIETAKLIIHFIKSFWNKAQTYQRSYFSKRKENLMTARFIRTVSDQDSNEKKQGSLPQST